MCIVARKPVIESLRPGKALTSIFNFRDLLEY